jgi:hypothetical protein
VKTGGSTRQLLRAGIFAKMVLALFICASVIAAVYYLATGGRLRPDDWIMRQIVQMSQTYIVPKLRFDRFEYVVPNKAVFHGVSFTAPDGITVIEAKHLSLTLAEIPKMGQPVRLGEVRIEEGRLRLARGRTPEEGEFRGLVPFVKRAAIRNQAEVPQDVRLSETLRIRRIDLVNCAVEYLDRTGRPPMVFDGITLDADLDQTETEGDTVWHTLTLDITRLPQLDVNLEGKIDLDRFRLRIDDFDLTWTLDDASYKSLSPDVREFVKQYDAKGQVIVDLRGDVPLTDPAGISLGGLIIVNDLNIAYDEARLPVKRIESSVAVASGILYLRNFKGEVMGGAIDGEASFDFVHPEGDSKVKWRTLDWSVSQMLRPGFEEPDDAPMTGRLGTTGNIEWSPRSEFLDLTGTGTLKLEGGSISALPGFDAIRNVLASADILGTRWTESGFEAGVIFDPIGIRSERFQFQTGAIGGTGWGRLNYDGSIDMTFSAGPIERLARNLGAFGRAVSGVTNRIVRYRLRGTIENPTLTVHPLGVGG